MTPAFMGNEMASFAPSDTDTTESTFGSLLFDSAFTRCMINCPSAVSYVETPQFTALTECWTHIYLAAGSYGATDAGHKIISWLNGSGTEVIRLTHTMGIGANEAVTLDYWTGAAWVTAGTATMSIGSPQHLDIRIVCNSASGSLTLYNAGTSRIAATGIDLSGIASIRKMRVYGSSVSSTNFATYFSQVVIGDDSTIGFRLMTRYPSGAGATSSLTGAYTDIDEIPYNDADFILSASANQVSTFSQTGPVVTGYTVKAVGVYARAKRDGSGPQNIRMALRSSGTDYYSGSDIALDLGYTPVGTIWTTNPATSAAWVNTAVDTLQPGVKSIA